MRRNVLSVVFGGALLAAVAVTGLVEIDSAQAKVHGVSQAGCANDPSLSGANQSGDNSPAGPIPVTVSPFDPQTFPGQGGDLNPDCDTAAVDVRQN
ncbi:MAG TPA: hypothetical protein VJ253_06055 [Dehalococcoidia bacterium]|nr:hypothetical protein [Dehalococcoidia bacterium]